LGTKTFRGGTRSVFEVILTDDTARLHCRWWNMPFMERLFTVGEELLVFGKVVSERPRTIDHPETEKIDGGDERSIHVGRVAPIYPLTEGLYQRNMRGMVWAALEQFGHVIKEPELAIVPSAPPGLNTPGAWMPRQTAVRLLHFPEEPHEPELARRRLALDEFVALQWEIQRRRKNLEAKSKAFPCAGSNALIRPFLAELPFKLTDAQTRVLREIRTDLGGSVPMRRLLQGDVGTGKTVVAACAALMTLESGYNVALMAPTQILADQLATNFRRWFGSLGIEVPLLTGNRSGDRESPPTSDRPTLWIGTHALIENGFTATRLGLVIIDEQHRFGVAQREKLVKKGFYPHLLVMTATPIPRTLGLTLYGDLDLSILDQSPEGRGRIRTHVRTPDALPKVWDFIRKELAQGRQAYIVYPRIQDSEEDDVKSVTREFPRVAEALKPYRVGLLHGQLNPDEKDQVMEKFRKGSLNALVATSVIEVGIDVPNATVMLIENAEQFGLAQLHQLRGRVGRGKHASHCILVGEQKTDAAKDRLKVMAETSDGFELAEADMRLRGPGELTGRAQSGLPEFRFGDLLEDRSLVELARNLVKQRLGNMK
jgi:ATP-dependent DNA helicase RecG